jgi:hypothetical protein
MASTVSRNTEPKARLLGRPRFWDRAELIQPEGMVPPLLWLLSDAAGKVADWRFLGVHWDPALPPEQAAEKAGAPVAWTSIATMPITPKRS